MPQVMVVDMLEGFTRIGPLASPRVDALIPKQTAFLRSLPSGSLVVFLADEHQPDDFELTRFPPHCLHGSEEARIREELLTAARNAESDIRIIRKRTFSGFVNTDLDSMVREAPSRSWIVFGCVTDGCIEANVAELVYRDCLVTVIRDLIDTWDRTPEAARAAGLSPAYVHEAARINDEWFTRRLPAMWGVQVIDRWQEALDPIVT